MGFSWRNRKEREEKGWRKREGGRSSTVKRGNDQEGFGVVY